VSEAHHHPARRVLVFTYGNPSRGDDALGPAMYELLKERRQTDSLLHAVALLTDFQLQIEHATDLQQRERVVFVDASLTASPPYEFQPLLPEQDTSYTTHAMSPAAVLAVYQQIHQRPPPPAFLLSIRGYEFDLGDPLSPRARSHLQSAFEFLMQGRVLVPDALADA